MMQTFPTLFLILISALAFGKKGKDFKLDILNANNNYKVNSNLPITPVHIGDQSPGISKLGYLSNCLAKKKDKRRGKIDISLLMIITINNNTMFLEEFFDKVDNLEFNKENIHVLVLIDKSSRNLLKKLTLNWIKNSKDFASIKKSEKGQDFPINYTKQLGISHILLLRSSAHLEDQNVIKDLINEDVDVISPYLATNHHESRSWADYQATGPTEITLSTILNVTLWNQTFVQRGYNFVIADSPRINEEDANFMFWENITQYKINGIPKFDQVVKDGSSEKGLSRVALVKSCILMTKKAFTTLTTELEGLDEDISISKSLKRSGFALHILGKKQYGEIVHDPPVKDKLHPELYSIVVNQNLWERRYIQGDIRKGVKHPPFDQNPPSLLPSKTIYETKCLNVYQMAIVTDKFCDDLIAESEHANKWFSAGNGNPVYDKRHGRRENVPGVDTNLWQLGLEEMWMAFINFYVFPRKIVAYPTSTLYDNGGHHFILRYRPEEQPFLPAHDDNSLFTINIALNRQGIDFKDGGTRFVRYNCSITDLPKGSALIHPGRLTHTHQGLTTTWGTRYIAVGFISSSKRFCYERDGEFSCYN